MIARTTKRPSKRRPKGMALAKRLTEKETREALRLTPEQCHTLDRIAAGRPPRNAQAIMGAIKLKLEYSQPKPAQKMAHTGPDGEGPVQHALEVTFVDGEAPPDGEPAAS